MDAKTQAVIGPLISLWQSRDDQLEERIISWAGSNLLPNQANELIGIVLRFAIDVRRQDRADGARRQPATTDRQLKEK